ncbi:ANTAR domain-containing protein [Streptomyces sp. MAR4 CNX-425]|uniref:ANTAR domain-containing protein n=1 Tax=Streptomyces sp. MAR4 CNX-425 TaxID=3406343 RepID=UPI003B503ABF
MRPPRSPNSSPDDGPPAPDDLTADVADAVADDEVSADLLSHVARRLIELSEENAQLKQAIESRPVVDQARGVLIAALGADEDEAWRVLLHVSQHANVPLRQVAEAVLGSATGRPMPEDLRTPLRDAMGRARRGTRHGDPG